MSKSAGNGIDPLEIVESHGADALKFSLMYMMAHGQNIRLAPQDFAIGSRFANKIWNAARFIFSYAERCALIRERDLTYSDLDRWIYTRLQETIRAVRDCMERYRFSEAAHAIYALFGNDFCDWYLAAAQIILNAPPPRGQHSPDGGDDTAAPHDDYAPQIQKEADTAYSHLIYLLEAELRLMHPFMSFITEELYQHLRPLLRANDDARYTKAIIIAPYPLYSAAHVYPELAERFSLLQEAISAIRTIKSQFSIAADKHCRATLVISDALFYEYACRQSALCDQLSGAEVAFVDGSAGDSEAGSSDLSAAPPETEVGIGIALAKCKVIVHIIDAIDRSAELQKLESEHAANSKRMRALEERLAPDSPFTKHAKAAVIEKERQRLNEMRAKQSMIKQFIADLRAL